jgi:hypothetical protein
VRTGYIGARAGDPDPWIWSTVPGKGVVLTLLAKKHPRGSVGWYHEQGGVPAIDGAGDGLVLERSRLRAAPTTLKLPASVKQFGLYVEREPGSTDIDGDGGAAMFFSNRMLNDAGPHGAGALRAPTGGDMQMLVYDISRFSGPDTWLVACEYSDAGAVIGTEDGQSDNDYSDIVFTISGVGVTATRSTTFGRLKALFR